MFDKRTRDKIQEFFADKKCCQCDCIPVRFVGRKFYCEEHLSDRYKKKCLPMEFTEQKVHFKRKDGR